MTFKSLRGKRSVFINLLECQLRYALCRAISTTHPCSKYRYVPTFNDPEKDVEYSEPGYAGPENDNLFEIPTRKQFKEQVKTVKDEFKIWKQEIKDGLNSNYDIVLPQGN